MSSMPRAHRTRASRRGGLADAAGDLLCREGRAMFDAVRHMAQAGARLIAGADAGVLRAGFDGLTSSLGFYEHLGLANEWVLAMAMSEAAAALGLQDETGQLTPGYSA